MATQTEFAWKGKKYALPARGQMAAIDLIETYLTSGELVACLVTTDPALAKLTRAWAGILRMAGVKITDEEAYKLLRTPPQNGGGSITDYAHARAALDLLSIMLLEEQFDKIVRTLEDAMAGKIKLGDEADAPLAKGRAA